MKIGYECGKKQYKLIEKNDLIFFIQQSKEVFNEVRTSEYGGECGWISENELRSNRLDANYLLNLIDRKSLHKKFSNLVQLNEICKIDNIAITIEDDKEYYYLEVPDISSDTGTINNIRKLGGSSIGSNSLYKFHEGDILFTRINPRISRVTIIPPIEGFGVVSKEVYRLVLKENKYIKPENKYFLCAVLQSEHVRNQIVRLSTGSSSSRARVQPEDLLLDVYVPIPDERIQKRISQKTYESMIKFWMVSQEFLNLYCENQDILGSSTKKDFIRKV